MKSNILLLTGLLLLFCSNISSKELPAENKSSLTDSLCLVSSPDLYELSVTWAREFSLLNPSAKIKVSSLPEGKTAVMGSEGMMGIFSQEDYSSIKNETAWTEVIGRDVMVPVINSENPFMAEILSSGISTEKLAQVFTHPDNRNWATLLVNAKNQPVKYYGISESTVKSRIVNFLKSDQIPLDGIEVTDSREMIEAIQKDPLALGFCKLSDIIDPGNKQLLPHIALMPIDRNMNGKMDYNEKIYDNLNLFTRGIWIGKYPKGLFSNIYAVSATQPSNETTVAFMKWIFTDGQRFVDGFGYSDLAQNERQANVDALITSNLNLAIQNTDKSQLKTILFILGLFLILSFILDLLITYNKNRKAGIVNDSPVVPGVLNENSVTVLNGLYFDKSHTWAFMKENGLVKIGIDDFLQHVTGTITQLKMKKPGDLITRGETVFSIIREGKQLNIKAPVSGIIREQNEVLSCNASTLNNSPYAEGWIYMIEPTNWLREIQLLFMGDKYGKWLKDELNRLRDFLSVYTKPGTLGYSQVILQDGGEIKDNPLSDLGPEVWEEFQTKFIDTSK